MSNCGDFPDYCRQKILVESLLDPGRYPNSAASVRVCETHISWVLLAGRHAYKIKKALDLGFLDYSSLDRRKYCCQEEVRLNGRLAPQIYLDAVPIGGSIDSPVLGVTPAIEYAVRMRRFAVSNQFDRLLERGKLTFRHLELLADLLADFHDGLPGAPDGSTFGAAATIREDAMHNFEPIRRQLTDPADLDSLARLIRLTESEYGACDFSARREQGFVRECHGDLHLGNIVAIGDAPVPFDGIEFNPQLRWIDTMNEAAFLVMDLAHRKRPDLAYRFLNRYLEATGDYAGIRVLRFYLAYRACVRAKVAAIRAGQRGLGARAPELRQCRGYLELAAEFLGPRRPALIITHGLPGSGKSTFAAAALERLGAIRIRSDVERKRLFGIKPLDDSRSAVGGGIYGEEATHLTYSRLYDLAREVLLSGYPVIVDAAFAGAARRERFRDLAQSLSVPFVIASIEAPAKALVERIRLRQAAANDASEADAAVLDMLRQAQQPLFPDEAANSVVFANDSDRPFSDESAWARLQELISAK